MSVYSLFYYLNNKVSFQINNKIYDYRNDEFGFTFTFHRRNESRREYEINDQISRIVNDGINEKLNKTIHRKNDLDIRLIRLQKENRYLTIPELAAEVSKSEATIHRHLDSLMKAAEIERIGSRKSGYWKVYD